MSAECSGVRENAGPAHLSDSSPHSREVARKETIVSAVSIRALRFARACTNPRAIVMFIALCFFAPEISSVSLAQQNVAEPAPLLAPSAAAPGATGAATPATGSLLTGANAPGTTTAPAPASATPFRLNIGLEGNGRPGDMSVAVQIVVVMTLLTLAPSMVILMTSFTRIVIVLGFVRTALGVPSAPSNQIIIGLSLFLTFFIMGPVVDRVNNEALQPYLAGRMNSAQAFDQASIPLKDFMLKQTRTRDLEFFLELGHFGPTPVNQLPMRVIIPSFVISELQTSFQMGFLLFLPFLVIDFLVSSVLMALGMMMMPPTVVALPFKLLLFVLVDGWHLVVKSLVESFRT
ncbi:MAG TPA: flagellar type III secretion system pore protein FliP [Opitutaceae bacterium]